MDSVNIHAQDRAWGTDSHHDEIDPSTLLSYSLEIVQQPQRARMCGFGDKDRRNVTPAPVLKLVARTTDGRLVPASLLSKQAFVVNADLWLDDEITERNLVLISSISSTKPLMRPLTSSSADPTIPEPPQHQENLAMQYPIESAASPPPLSSSQTLSSIGPSLAPADPRLRYPDNYRSLRHFAPHTPMGDRAPASPQGYRHDPHHSRSSSPGTATTADDSSGHTPRTTSTETDSHAQFESTALHDSSWRPHHNNSANTTSAGGSVEGNSSTEDGEKYVDDRGWDGVSTQNLVGQTTVGGQIAPDLDGMMNHIWFAFSVLSIRTEGIFKLRFSLCNLTQISESSISSTPIICQTFSDPIQVQSPKRFLGTIDNNDIANHLNKYSIRIPSRKDEKVRPG